MTHQSIAMRARVADVRGIPGASVSEGTVEVVVGDLEERRDGPQHRLRPRFHLECARVVSGPHARFHPTRPVEAGGDCESRVFLELSLHLWRLDLVDGKTAKCPNECQLAGVAVDDESVPGGAGGLEI